MKEGTKLGLMFVGAGVASNMLLGSTVGGYTSAYAMPAAAAEGLGAIGGGYYAWKKKSKAGAIIGGVLAGLLVSSVQGGLLSPAPAKAAGGATPQSTNKTSTLPAAGLPTPAVAQGPGTAPLLPTQTTTLPGFTSVSGQIPKGSAVPKPNYPASAQETQAYMDYMAQELQNQQLAMAQQAAALQQGGLPMDQSPPIVADYDQSGAVVRVGMVKPQKRGGFGAGATMRRGY